MNVHVFKEPVNTCRKGDNPSVDRHIVFSLVDVVSYYLDRKVRSRVETILGEEHCADAFRVFKMAKFECYVFFQSVEIAIYCSVVPSGRNDKVQPGVNVIGGSKEMIKFIVEAGEVLLIVFGVR